MPDTQENRPRVPIELHFQPGYLPQLHCYRKPQGWIVERLAALFAKSYLGRTVYLGLGLAVVARDPASSQSLRENWADALIDHLADTQGQGALALGYQLCDLKEAKRGKPPVQRHRRLPKPQKGRRTKWTPEYQDAVPKIIKAVRSENWKGLTSN